MKCCSQMLSHGYSQSLGEARVAHSHPLAWCSDCRIYYTRATVGMSLVVCHMNNSIWAFWSMEIRPAAAGGTLVNAKIIFKNQSSQWRSAPQGSGNLSDLLVLAARRAWQVDWSSVIPDVLSFSLQLFPPLPKCNLTAGLVPVDLIFAVIRHKELNHVAQTVMFSISNGGISNQ